MLQGKPFLQSKPGPHRQAIQAIILRIMAKKTAALPISFAFFMRWCVSYDILSDRASIAEFKSSTISSSINAAIKTAFRSKEIGKK